MSRPGSPGTTRPVTRALRIDDAPVLEARPRRRSARLANEGGRVNRAEQSGTLQIAGDHLCDLAADLGIRLIRTGQIHERNRERLHMAARDVHAEFGPGVCGDTMNRQTEDDGGGEGQGAAHRPPGVSTQYQQSSHRRSVASSISKMFKRNERLTPAD